jgi:glycosyltransferase involved in cell wall biosynthesis
MNKGIDVAKGDYIQFLNSDDFLSSEDIIHEVAQILLSDSSIDILSCSVYLVEEVLCLQKLCHNQVSKQDIYNGSRIPHQGSFTSRELLQRIKFDTSYYISADDDFFLKCYFDSTINIKYINLPVVFFSLSGISSLNTPPQLEGAIRLVKKYNLNQDIILKIQKQSRPYIKIINNINKYRRLLANKIGFFKRIRIKFRFKRGWSKHSCEWSFCRWCKNRM